MILATDLRTALYDLVRDLRDSEERIPRCSEEAALREPDPAHRITCQYAHETGMRRAAMECTLADLEEIVARFAAEPSEEQSTPEEDDCQ